MRLHCLQHVAFEGPANIESWAKSQGWEVSATRLYAGEHPSAIGRFDWLAVMGGPMNIYEEDLYPWLVPEKKFIEKAIGAEKIVLGVCLGAQLVADVLGGKVYRNAHKEIGWYPVTLTPEAARSPSFSTLAERFMAFHWHGDTFTIPPGATRTAYSEACQAQAFEYGGGRTIGLQFHLESSPESAGLLIQNCGDELVAGKYIQDGPAIASKPKHFEAIRNTMTEMLDNLKRAFC